ncbi:MAG: hypothetical protein AAB225_12910 [Acidobacteriota bacterium]
MNPPLAMVGSFRPPISPDEFVQNFEIANGSFLFLISSRLPGGARLVRTSPEGTVKWTWVAPSGRSYAGLGLRPSGAIVLPYFVRKGREPGGFLDELTQTGAVVRTLRLPFATAVWEFVVTGDNLLTFREDGSVVSMNLQTSAIRTLTPGLTRLESARVHVMSDSEVLIVDRLEARLGRLGLGTERCEWATLEAPELADSLRYFSERWRQSTASVQAGAVLRGPVVGASCVATDGSFYFLLQPISRVKGAVLLRARRSSGVDARLLVQLPGKDLRRLLPHWLAVVENRLFLIYGDGYVDEYQLP